MTADVEDEFIVCQATEPMDENNNLINDRVTCRHARRIRRGRPQGRRSDGRFSAYDDLGRDRVHPVPRPRRRKPRTDGREHAASGGSAARAPRLRSLRPAWSTRPQSTPAPSRWRRATAWLPALPRARSSCSYDNGTRKDLSPDQVPAFQPVHLHQPCARSSIWASASRRATFWRTARLPIRARSRSARTRSSAS